MFDPANDLRWTGGITSSTPAPPGPHFQIDADGVQVGGGFPPH